jgi:hypothetical protein
VKHPSSRRSAWLLLASLGLALLAGEARAADVPATTAAAPARPSDPRASKAYGVFETYCARCHQTGRLEQPLASGGIANIQAIDELARDPVLVKPGIPDASRLYDVLETRHAPLDVFLGPAPAAEPQPDDILAIRRWIEDLPPDSQTCPSRKPVHPADVDAMMRDAQRLERDQAGDVRFVSLVHFYNSCATSTEMTAYVAALNKLMNSLSSAREPIKLTPLDAAGSVLSFRLSDFGWTRERWKRIEDAYPPALARSVAPDVVKVSGSKAGIVNGDWLAAAAGEAPLYYDLLGIPSKLGDFAAINGTNIDANIRAGSVRRIAVSTSSVTRGNRLIERHPGSPAGLWLVYDFATSTGEQNIFQRPLGPKSATSAPLAFQPDEIRALLELPNGFYAFALFDAGQNAVNSVAGGIEQRERVEAVGKSEQRADLVRLKGKRRARR